MMKRAPIFPKSETGGDYMYSQEQGFDPHLDFSLFLEEARSQAANVKLCSASIPSSKLPTRKEEKSNKSWKKNLFSWLKVDKKKKPSTSTNMVAGSSSVAGPNILNSKCKTVSGQIYGSARQKTLPEQPHRRPHSGPLTGLFSRSKRSEDVKVPYASLEQLNHPTDTKVYGPVYMVT